MSTKDRPGRNAKDKQRLLKIGDNIRTIRKQRGYSQEEFADIAGFSRSYYTEIETGKRNISVLNLLKIIEALDAKVNDIFGNIKSK
jgi:transcriptional regulator with XRE-family HTH domain